MFSDRKDRRLIDRRSLLAALVTGGIGYTGTRVLAQEATPAAATPEVATPVVATPEMTPTATPIPVEALPGTSTDPDFPLQVIREQRPMESEVPVAGGTLRLCVHSAFIDDFSPVSFLQDMQVSASLYDSLIWLDDVTCEPQPCLAKSWEWENGGKRLTFHLRDDVTWHDGSPFLAVDAAFSLTVLQQDWLSAVGGFFSLVRQITTADDHTVVVDFTEADGAFLFNAGSLPIFQSSQYGFLWSSRALGERSLDGFRWDEQPPIGTGPWKLSEMRSDGLTLQRNDSYWNGAPYYETLELAIQDSETNRLDGWKQDSVDVVWPVAPDVTTDMVQQSGRLYAADSLRSLFAAYNFNNPARINPQLFSEISFRQALLLAMDRRAYQQSIFGSFIETEKAGTIAQPWARDERIVNPDRNLEIANGLLDGLFWVDNDGDGIRETPDGDVLLLTAIVEDTSPPELRLVMEEVAGHFSAIGVGMEVQVLDHATFQDRWVNLHDFDLIGYSLLGYGAFNEFDLYGSAWDIRVNSFGWNPGGYSNSQVDAALDEYFRSYEVDDMRIALYKLQRAVTDDPFGLFFGFPQDPVLVRPGVLGFQPNKMWQSWNTRLMWKANS